MRDVLNEIAKLSLLLQREDVTLPSIMIKVESVQLALSEMMANLGRNLQRCQEELNGAVYKEHTLTHVVAQNSLTQKRRITQELRDCLDSRFSNLQEPIYKSCNIFDHSNWPDDVGFQICKSQYISPVTLLITVIGQMTKQLSLSTAVMSYK